MTSLGMFTPSRLLIASDTSAEAQDDSVSGMDSILDLLDGSVQLSSAIGLLFLVVLSNLGRKLSVKDRELVLDLFFYHWSITEDCPAGSMDW